MTDDEVRRELATRLAAGDGDPLTLVSLMTNGGALHLPSRSGRNPNSALAEDLHGFLLMQSTSAVGIWESDPVTGGFRRSRAHADLWRFCADVDHIPPKGIQPRIAFLGESTARGFFYDPFYAPARVLSDMMAACGKQVEVVDLAQSNIDGRSLSVIAASSHLLQPDIIVVFAGNNWQTPGLRLISAESFVRDGESLARPRGFSTIADRLRRQLTAYAEKVIRAIAASASSIGIPLVFVIPEINLSTWSNCPHGTLDLPHLDNEDLEHWLNGFNDAERAWADGDFATARDHLQRVIDIDAGVSAASLNHLGKVLLGLGERRAAAKVLRQSRGLTLRVIDGTFSVPGIVADVADTIRRVALDVGASVVDLPRVFEQHAESELCDGSLHLDYCHLTSKGIRLAMSATAEAVGSILNATIPAVPTLAAAGPRPSDEQEGWAHLLAAVHNAHWGQSQDSCAQHVRLAVEHNPALLDHAITAIYDAFCHKAPAIFVESFDSLVKNRAAEVYLIGYGAHYQNLGRISEYSLLAALRTVGGPHCRMALDPDYSLGTVEELDFLDGHFSALSDGNRYFSRAFAAMYAPRSEWSFACDEPRPLSLSLTCRIPGALISADVGVFVNDILVATVAAGAEWQSLHCIIRDADVTAGSNRLSLVWPIVPRRDLRADLRSEFEQGYPVDACLHFGEVHELLLSLVP